MYQGKFALHLPYLGYELVESIRLLTLGIAPITRQNAYEDYRPPIAVLVSVSHLEQRKSEISLNPGRYEFALTQVFFLNDEVLSNCTSNHCQHR